jgi:hypothetical protein
MAAMLQFVFEQQTISGDDRIAVSFHFFKQLSEKLAPPFHCFWMF